MTPPQFDGALIGRAEELAAVAEATQAGGCVVAGPSGVGKTRLVAEVASAEPAVERVKASASAVDLSYGAFMPLLDTDYDGPVVPSVLAELRRRHGKARPVLVVDDAHLLDDASAALVLAAAASGAARPLITLRTPEPAPDAITSLWKDGLAARLDLMPLGASETSALVDDILGPSHRQVHERIYELSLGNPLFARELLIDAKRAGTVAMTGDRWAWTGAPLSFTRLRDLVGARLSQLSPDAAEALEVLAVGAPLPLDVIEAVAGTAPVEELERASLARSEDTTSGASIDLTHPVYAIGWRPRTRAATGSAPDRDLRSFRHPRARPARGRS